jgi:hypothetical protein
MTGNAPSFEKVAPRRAPVDQTGATVLQRSSCLFGLPLLILLGGCDANLPDCDTSEIRTAVLKRFSDDPSNRLYAFVAKNSTATAQPLYALEEKIVTVSASADQRTMQCSGDLSVTLDGTSASKQVDFAVQKAADGKISVSVTPFQF